MSPGLLTDLSARVARSSILLSKCVARNNSIGLTIDGGGSPIPTGQKGYVQCPFGGTIARWTLLADQVGSCVVDVWKTTFALAPPTVLDTIAGSQKPTLASHDKAEDTALSTWDATVKPGDVLGFNVDSASTITRLSLVLWVRL